MSIRSLSDLSNVLADLEIRGSTGAPPPSSQQAKEPEPQEFTVKVFAYEEGKAWKALVTLNEKIELSVSSVYLTGLPNEIKNVVVRQAKEIMFGPQIYFRPRPRVSSPPKQTQKQGLDENDPKKTKQRMRFTVLEVKTKAGGKGEEFLEKEVKWKLREK
jgi:hypothetical protein